MCTHGFCPTKKYVIPALRQKVIIKMNHVSAKLYYNEYHRRSSLQTENHGPSSQSEVFNVVQKPLSLLASITAKEKD